MASSGKNQGSNSANHLFTDGLFNVNSFLDHGSPGFTHSNHVKPDHGRFSLDHLQRDGQRADRGGSSIIVLPKERYLKVPQLAKGLSACHLNHLSRDRTGTRAMDIEIAIVTHPKNTTAMRPVIQARNSSNSTQLIRTAAMTWMEAKQGAKDCWITTTKWDLTSGQKRKKRVDFPRPFDREVEVLCWIKDFRFMAYDESPFALDLWASDITRTGFTAHVSGSRAAERVVATWIVHYKGKPKVSSGTFGTPHVERQETGRPDNAGSVVFPVGTFTRPPTVLVGLSRFDHAGGRDLRIEAKVLTVDQDGFDWQLNTWGDRSDSALRAAGASYIALGFV